MEHCGVVFLKMPKVVPSALQVHKGDRAHCSYLSVLVIICDKSIAHLVVEQKAGQALPKLPLSSYKRLFLRQENLNLCLSQIHTTEIASKGIKCQHSFYMGLTRPILLNPMW